MMKNNLSSNQKSVVKSDKNDEQMREKLRSVREELTQSKNKSVENLSHLERQGETLKNINQKTDSMTTKSEDVLKVSKLFNKNDMCCVS
jgi:L-lactate utilization protein LutB